MENLFSEIQIRQFLTKNSEKVSKKINALDSISFSEKSVEQISQDLLKQYLVVAPSLQEHDIYQKTPKDLVQRNKFGQSIIVGTEFEIRVPFNGISDLFDTRPTRFSQLIPYGKVVNNEIQFFYTAGAGADTSELQSEITRNIENVKKWLSFVDDDAQQYNETLKQDILQAVAARKQKLMSDNDSAAKLGIPIR